MKTILLADDDADVRTVFGMSLERYYRILEAATGTRALEMIRRERPDLVIEIIYDRVGVWEYRID